mgnify:CR=1 FL=1
MVDVTLLAREESRLTVILLGLHYLTEGGILHTPIREQSDVDRRAIVLVIMHSVSAGEVGMLHLEVASVGVHFSVEGLKCCLY